MKDLKQLMQSHFISYASYVILERAIPHRDGLKPVQRRILHTLSLLDTSKLHKVANVAGQTMALHPHGDAPIVDALVNLANKGYLLERQGNFGNPLTGDAAAAARYIEVRLTPLARETLFNPDLTPTIPSYDGRALEPLYLPAKIPLVLLHGAEGIAVGMATSIFPHNFCEVLEAEKAVLEDRSFQLFPDFFTGGWMDVSDYREGRGKIQLRAKIEIVDPKTLRIREICHGTTTESLIQSIDEAAKKGKLKIDAMHDYTADSVDIEIKLPRGQYAEELIPLLYTYTECALSLSSQVVVIEDQAPIETTVSELLIAHTKQLVEFLQKELELEQNRLQSQIFRLSLERLFIEKRIYKQIEELKSMEAIYNTLKQTLEPFCERSLETTDLDVLLAIPIRRISRFDLSKNEQDLADLQAELKRVQKDLKQPKKVAIRYLDHLLKKYGSLYPRKTEITTFDTIDKKSLETKEVRVKIDYETGFVGTHIVGKDELMCTNYDKLLFFFKDGTYQVLSIPEKQYFANLACVVVADKKTPLYVLYRDRNTHLVYGKHFLITQFIQEKLYRFLEEGAELEAIGMRSDQRFILHLLPKLNQRKNQEEVGLEKLSLKGVGAKGARLSPLPVKKVVPHGRF